MPAGTDALLMLTMLVVAIAIAAGASLAIFLPGHRPTMIAAAIASVAMIIVGLAVIVGPPLSIRLGSVLGYSLFDLRFDALSGVFLIALGAVGATSSVYAVGYHEAGRSRLDTLAYVVFLASLAALVFGSASAFSFLFAWELMAISSAVLVIGPRPDRSVVGAGYVYLAMTHIATAAIAVAFAIWSAAAGSLDFAFYGGAAASLDGPARDVIFILLLLGFGTKAGMMPLHVWLPRAHPVAPSHVSALMSGVMIKAGIFGIVRFAIELLGPGPVWWGLLVLALGAGLGHPRRALRPGGARPQAPAGVPQHREHRHHPDGARRRPGGRGGARHRAGGGRAGGGAVPHASTTRSSRRSCSWVRERCRAPPAPATSTGWAASRA